jgi:hypothetical protein
MTMPVERTRAVMQARQFLQELALETELPANVRREAQRLLRHYPRLSDMQLAHLALPTWFGPPHVGESTAGPGSQQE